MGKKSWGEQYLDSLFASGKKSGSGERRKSQVHQETSSGKGNYHSRSRADGGRVITVGENRNHTSFKYDKDGKFEGRKSRGDGGNARNYKP